MDKRTLRRFPLNVNDTVNLYLSGVSVTSIARDNHCSVKAILNCLNREGVYMNGRDWKNYLFRKTGLMPADLLAMYNSGLWKNEIASKIGISEGAVGKYLSYLGVPLADNKSQATKRIHERGGKNWSKAVTYSAHNAVKGMKRTEESLIQRANTLESIGRFGSTMERVLFDMLAERGICAIPQKAFSKYNIDLMVGNVAVEITGRNRKPQDIPEIKKKIKLLLDSGFSMIWLWANTSFPIRDSAADYIASYCESVCLDPSIIGEYRVIRCDGKLMSSGRSDSDDFSGVFTAINGTFSRPRN